MYGVKSVLSAAVLPPRSTVSVLTTLSFAVKPVMSAVEILQSSNPRGRNSGAISEPIAASMLSEESETGLRRISKVCRNQMMIAARKMIVNYFVGLVVIFAILVACPYLIRGIAALVT